MHLVVEPASEQLVAKAINDTKAGQVRGGTATDEETGDTESKSYVHITYDPKVGGEASSFPHLRVPPLRGSGSHLCKMVKGVQAARGKPNEMDPGDLHSKFIIFNSYIMYLPVRARQQKHTITFWGTPPQGSPLGPLRAPLGPFKGLGPGPLKNPPGPS